MGCYTFSMKALVHVICIRQDSFIAPQIRVLLLAARKLSMIIFISEEGEKCTRGKNHIMIYLVVRYSHYIS